ncbi:MAG: hypothetical protein JWR72_4082 [Flavisolibacter sp.]|nr:hypothetical protein [Flavisolibacter sp.]
MNKNEQSRKRGETMKMSVGKALNGKNPALLQGFSCPGLDSNQHAVSSTTTSRWLVYQFQHLGKEI